MQGSPYQKYRAHGSLVTKPAHRSIARTFDHDGVPPRPAWPGIDWMLAAGLLLAVVVAFLLLGPSAHAQSSPAATTSASISKADKPLLRLGTGDAVNVQVFSRPELTTTTYVADDGTITVPLAGPVKVAGLSPAEAAQRVATALKAGEFLVNPQVTITLVQFRSQQVSVLGEVRNPGRFPVESKITVFDLLAQAGGVTEAGADVIYLIRPDKNGAPKRHAVDLKGIMSDSKGIDPAITIEGGDSIFVPRAEQFYVYGEVANPNMYKLEPGMTVVQAISRSGGITERGSENRIEIRRRDAKGKYKTFDADLTDTIEPNDVIRVKERIF